MKHKTLFADNSERKEVLESTGSLYIERGDFKNPDLNYGNHHLAQKYCM